MSTRARRYLNKRCRELKMSTDAGISDEMVVVLMENYHQHCREREQTDKLDKQLDALREIFKKVKP